MTDITKCTGKDCPIKDRCRRFTAPKSFYQSWFLHPPFHADECEYYIEDRKAK